VSGVRVRHLSLGEVLQRQRARHAEEISAHNAGIVERLDLGPRPSRRDQVLEQFDPATRRLIR
jgi:hypothetical protein